MCSLDHTDASMRIEHRMEDLKEHVVKPAFTKFYVGDVMFDFSPKDPIFDLSGPCKSKSETPVCPTCTVNSLTKKFSVVYCNFCARANCKSCCQKERLYPKGLRNDDGDRPRGKICRVCEGKFHIR